METKAVLKERETTDIMITELADAHCHLDLIQDPSVISDAITAGVRTMVTNGVDTKSNVRAVELSDGRHIFAALGIDPEHAINISGEELEFNIGMIKSNAKRIVAIGEIGLDYKKAADLKAMERQRAIFEGFLDLAESLNLPVCIHSRNALDDVLSITGERKSSKVQIHFFEGNVQQAKEIERRGYMISVPPLDSGKRTKAIKEIAIDNIMAESDAPVAGSTPLAVRKSVEMIAAAKGMSFESAAEAVTLNTKRFFNLHAKAGLMRA